MTENERSTAIRRTASNKHDHRIPAEFGTRLRLMLIWEARLQAREIVKRKLKAEGVRVSLLSASTITRHADKYLLSQTSDRCQPRAGSALSGQSAAGVTKGIRAHEIPCR